MISIEHLYFSYTRRAPWLLRDIQFSLAKGSYISIVGSNGSGKSTLLRLILGELAPSAGKITIQARRIGYVPQRSAGFHSAFPITVGEVMDSYRVLLHIHDKSAAAHALSLTGMDGYQSRLMGELSGGEHQRVLIARSLMGSPDLLILDEPSTGVDRENQRIIYGLLHRFRREQGLTVLAVEHNWEAAERSDALYRIHDGEGTLSSPKEPVPLCVHEGGSHA